ncbi:MAG: Mrp/NBP35 family ATP-binding protein [Gemmatimonadota bacterium]|nr:MAG: Mrp/NBP35 family ATP-binding protein [Gemmatimonadota bacterium]
MADERELVKQVAMALRSIVDPATGRDIVASGSVEELKAGGPGEVDFVLLTGPDDPAGLAEQARAVAESVDGVEIVRMEVRAGGSRGGRKLPVMGQAGGGGREPAATPASPTPDTVPGVERVIAVSSGTGGVGKSTVAANLAVALAKRGARVGLMDADVYGPNIPIMFGVYSRPGITADEKVVPIESHGVKLMSIGFLLDEDTPAIWRGPIVMGIIRQFLQQVEWGELDYLIVDMPPGTGDAQLSLVQLAKVDGAVLVTTPQGVATADVLKGIKMFERVEVPVLGLVENMSGFLCPHCGERTDVFGRGGGSKLAATAGVPFLGEIPLGAAVVEASDSGQPTVASAPDSPEAQAFMELAEKLVGVLQEAMSD